MIDLQIAFIEYVKCYIEILTKGREEFFISLCDIEEKFLKEMDHRYFDNYQVVSVSNEDYSKAVHYRNDINIERIVLLSGEGIKQIDSLKDFNEYSILPQDKKLLLECLQKAFKITIEPSISVYFEIILEQGEVAFADLFSYLSSCISRGKILPSKLNEKLYLLGIWKSSDKTVLKKGKIRRMIKNSRYSVVDNRLTRALMNHMIDEEWEQKISKALSKGNLQVIFSSVPYEIAEKWLKKVPGEKKEHAAVSSASNEEKTYKNSFEYKISENSSDDIKKIEYEWMKDNEKEDSEYMIKWEDYEISKSEVYSCHRRIDQFIDNVKISNLPASYREKIINKVLKISNEFLNVQKDIIKATPVCMKLFCDYADAYTKSFFELLSEMITDESFRDMDASREIMKEFLFLFCRVEDYRIRMPYFHPVRVFYYKIVTGLYESALDETDKDEVKNTVWNALIEKVAMQFPIEFFRKEEKRFALDHTTILNGYMEFTSLDYGMTYSVLDFKIVQQQILDYIILHPYLTCFTICLVDISDLSGLYGLILKMRRLSEREEINIGRVDFLILSAKEEELKKMLSHMWDAIGSDDIVRFRFGRNMYLQNGKYDLIKITKESDMVIMADNALLYREPRLAVCKENMNSAFERIKDFDFDKQVDSYIKRGKSDIPVMWDTMQQIAYEGQEGYWRWKSREFDSRFLEFINRTVQSDKDKTFIVLSSNEHILSEIYQTQYMQAFRKKYNGRNITILSFSLEKKECEEGEKDKIYCSLSELYDEALGLEGLPGKILAGAEDIYLKIWNENGTNICQCIVQTTEDESELESEWKEICQNWMKWQFDIFLKKENMLTRYFIDLWRSQMNAGGGEICSVLLAERLCKGAKLSYYYEKEIGDLQKEKSRKKIDCTQAVKVHELLQFLALKPAIDERTKNLFQEQYDSKLLLEILMTEGCKNLLEEREYEQLIKLRERVSES